MASVCVASSPSRFEKVNGIFCYLILYRKQREDTTFFFAKAPERLTELWKRIRIYSYL
jgi:hypothetical protein